MNPTLTKILLSVGFAVLAAVYTDFDSYQKSLELDPLATFNWKLCLARVIKTAIGAGAAAGGVYGLTSVGQ